MPLTTRVPQNGGVGMLLSVATSERRRVGQGGVVDVGRLGPDPSLAQLGQRLADAELGVDRALATASISRRPSNASLA